MVCPDAVLAERVVRPGGVDPSLGEDSYRWSSPTLYLLMWLYVQEELIRRWVRIAQEVWPSLRLLKVKTGPERNFRPVSIERRLSGKEGHPSGQQSTPLSKLITEKVYIASNIYWRSAIETTK